MRQTLVFNGIFAIVLTATGCSSGSKCNTPGGSVAGPADKHCTGVTPVVPQQSLCNASATDGNTTDANASNANTTNPNRYGATMYNASGSDDDCKYNIVWSITPVCLEAGSTITMGITRIADQSPVTGAKPHLEVFFDASHPAPNAGTVVTENQGGRYTFAPVMFDTSGLWTVRVHLFDTCQDVADSPNGHAAFYVSVPSG